MAEKLQKKLKTAKNRATKDRLNKRKHHLSLARKSFKNRRIREAGNILQKREVFGQNRRVGIVVVYFKDNFSHNIPKCQQQSVRLCLQSFTEQRNKNKT